MCRTCDDNPSPIDMVRAFIDATTGAGCLEDGDTMCLVVPDDFLQHLGEDIAAKLGRPLDRIDIDHYLYDMGVIVARQSETWVDVDD